MTAFVIDNIAEPPPNTFITFSDGSHVPEVGAGAATAWYNPAGDPPALSEPSVLRVRVGDDQDTTPYQAELSGFELVVANAQAKALQLTKFFWFFTDNQTLIRDLTEPLRAKAGMNTCIRIQASLRKLIRQHPGSKVSIIWCPSRSEVAGMTAADAAAKAAVSLPQVLDTTPNPASTKTRIKAQLRAAASIIPPKLVVDRLLGSFDPVKTYSALCKLSRPDATFIAKVRAGHCPLNGYLFRFKAANTPNCDVCSQKEDVDHLLTVCRKFAGLQKVLFGKARTLKVQPTRKGLLTNPSAYQDVANFGRQTFRFYRARFKRHIHRPTKT